MSLSVGLWVTRSGGSEKMSGHKDDVPDDRMVLETVRTQAGDVGVWMTAQAADQLRVARQLMERWKVTLAILAKS